MSCGRDTGSSHHGRRYGRALPFVLLVCTALVLAVAFPRKVEADTIDPAQVPSVPGFDLTKFSQMENGFDRNRGAVTLYWTIENAGSNREEILHGALVLDATKIDQKYSQGASLANGWVAIGLGRCMLASEFIMVHALPSGTGVEVKNLISSADGYKAPVDNPGQSMFVSNGTLFGYQGNGLIVGEFRRYTQALDIYHKSININEVTQFIWAYNANPKPTNAESYKVWHSFDRGRYLIQLATGSPADTAPVANLPLRYTHGAAMGFTWTLIFPFAIFWARFGKSMPQFNIGWMWVHIVMQALGAAITASFIILVITTIPDSVNWGPATGPFVLSTRAHPVMGFIILGLVVVQLWLGPLNRLSLSVESLFAYRTTIRFLHRYTGRIALILAFVQVGLGLNTFFCFPDGPFDGRGGIIWWSIYFILISFWTILFIGTEAFWWFKVRKAEGGFVSRKTGQVYGRIESPAPGRDAPSAGPARGKFGLISGGTNPEDALVVKSAPPPQQQQQDSTFLTATKSATAQASRSNSSWRQFTWGEIDEALYEGQLLVVAKGRYVYDINRWIYSHPGGQIVLNQVAGTDITNDYFHEAGFDAGAFVPKPTVPAATNRRLPTPSLNRQGGNFGSSTTLNPDGSTTSNVVVPKPSVSLPSGQDLAGVPPLSDQEWKYVLKARRTNVHSRLAIEKLSSLMVGEMRGTQDLQEGVLAPFSPYEYRRYSLIESCIVPNARSVATPVYKQKFCILFPHDMRANEPHFFFPGQCIEIQLRVRNKEYVSRYYTPIAGSLACFTIMVKLAPQGALTPSLVRQKPGDRQIKIRGPFGTPIVDPERPLPGTITPQSPSGSWAFEKLVVVVGGSGLAAALHLVEWLFMPTYTPLLVIQSYEPVNYDEIALSVGDWVITKEHLYDGWAVGVNLRTGQEGLFPLPVTYPRCGNATTLAILNCMHTADDAFGSDVLRGALVAYGPYVTVTHVLTRGIGSLESGPPAAVEKVCPGTVVSGRGRIDAEILGNTLWAAKWNEGSPGARKVVVCGPQGFEGAIYEMCMENLGVQHEEILMLPPDSYI
ncbi:hypothetical protein DFJ73DRAFT_67666 [Zopfochytrium polystomum]|nr:hypothetical protein DFJ73DRAFT_67666 [Zopfochytrium polystomum]